MLLLSKLSQRYHLHVTTPHTFQNFSYPLTLRYFLFIHPLPFSISFSCSTSLHSYCYVLPTSFFATYISKNICGLLHNFFVLLSQTFCILSLDAFLGTLSISQSLLLRVFQCPHIMNKCFQCPIIVLYIFKVDIFDVLFHLKYYWVYKMIYHCCITFTYYFCITLHINFVKTSFCTYSNCPFFFCLF